MPSALYEGWVRHQREHSVRHEFQYRVFMTLIDLSQVDGLESRLLGFSRSGFAPFRLRPEDHGLSAGQAIRPSIVERLGKAGVPGPIGRIELLTNLRSFGHCFNPICVYFCYQTNGSELAALVLEVSNTPWGERHWYVLPSNNLNSRFGMDKTFHVSPFLPMNMRYEVFARAPGQLVQLALSNLVDDQLAHRASLVLKRKELTSASLWSAHLRYFLHTRRTLLRIHWQALKLWLKGARFHKHPEASTDS